MTRPNGREDIFTQLQLQQQPVVQQTSARWTFDQIKHYPLPSHFRIACLGDNFCSGSAQFTQPQLEAMVGEIRRKNPLLTTFCIVDLREETHGFINGFPFSLRNPTNDVNRNLAFQKIQEKETALLTVLNHQSTLTIDHIIEKDKQHARYEKSIPYLCQIEKKSIKTEEQIVRESAFPHLSFLYRRFPVTDHEHPSKTLFNSLLDFLYHHSSHWIHFHCRGGKGRTTLALALFQKITTKQPINEILHQQREWGGSNLFSIDKGWKSRQAKERLAFLQSLDNLFKLD